MWVKTRDFILSLFLNYGVKALINTYNYHGKKGVDELFKTIWGKVDNISEKYLGKENSNRVLKDIAIPSLESQLENIKKESND